MVYIMVKGSIPTSDFLHYVDCRHVKMLFIKVKTYRYAKPYTRMIRITPYNTMHAIFKGELNNFAALVLKTNHYCITK